MWRYPQRAQRIQDYCYVDHFLQQGALDRGQIAEGRRRHAEDGKPNPRDDAFDGNAARASRNLDPRAQPVDPIDQKHDVGRLGRGRRAPCAPGDAHVRRGQCRRVVHAVAYRHRGSALALREDEQHLLVGCQPGAQPVETEPLGHTLRHIGAVAGGQQYTPGPFAAKPIQHDARAFAQRIGHDEAPRHVPVDPNGDEDGSGGHRWMIARPPTDPGRHEAIAADDDVATLDMAHDAFAWDLRHLGRHGQREAPRLRGGDNGLRHGMLRGLVECCGKAQDFVLGHAVVTVDRHDPRAAMLAVRASIAPLRRFRDRLAARSERDLSPIASEDLPAEVAPIAATLNTMLHRLNAAFEAERGFAANAAHELRTPLAGAIAQAQRLQSETTDDVAADRAAEIETTLKRLTRRTERLMQLARAEGARLRLDRSSDLRPALLLIINEIKRSAGKDRIELQLTDAPIMSDLDPDALGILCQNLVENALRHGDPTAPVEIELTPAAVLIVTNEGRVVPTETLTRMTDRFERLGFDGAGSGLGLAIVTAISERIGSRLELKSPRLGRDSGLEARMELAGHLEAPKCTARNA